MANRFRQLIFLLSMTLLGGVASAEESIILASTTSTDQSGLFGYILPRFEAKTGIKVKVVALGTGQALDTARRGDADVLLVHDRPAEDKFVAEGWGIERRDVMYNDFIVVGPKADGAKVKETKDVSMVSAASRPARRRSSHAATRAARTRPNCASGRKPVLIRKSGRPTRKPAPAWARRST